MDIAELASWRLLLETDIENLLSETLILINGVHSDERCTYFESKLGNSSPIIQLTYDRETYKLDGIQSYYDSFPSLNDGDPVVNVEEVVRFLLKQNTKIVIDMTSLSTEVLFILLKAFHDEKYDDLIVLYVQPNEYKKSVDNLIPNFMLSEEHSPVSSIPGFLRLPNDDKRPMLVVFIGFEGGRFQELCEHLLTEGPVVILPVLPMPSYNAGWHMLGLYLNMDTLKSVDIMSDLRRVTAWDPFYALSVLEDQYNNFSDERDIIVAPLGTKPHTLATILFSVKNDDVRIMYDHPKIFTQRSIGVGEIRGYNIKGLLI